MYPASYDRVKSKEYGNLKIYVYIKYNNLLIRQFFLISFKNYVKFSVKSSHGFCG